MIPEKERQFISILLEWFASNRRDFPWRRTKDPYKILIAEVMLQRTKADQVVPTYESFLKRYPDPHTLSEASVAELKAEIFSLGLEKRAEGLKKLAEQLIEEHGGKIPSTKDSLVKLHGVGNYIANAILCHSFGVDVPTVDANFARLLVRVFSLKPKHPAQKDKRIWAFAESLMLLVRGRARVLNLAILDLASKICTPQKPSCRICPLESVCDYAVKAQSPASLRSMGQA